METARKTGVPFSVPFRLLLFCGLPLLMLIAYGNHFQNSFHFDDTHAIVENPYVRELGNIPRFFTDGTTSSSLPPNRVYRPIIYVSFAVDYALGHGLVPLWFHISTFFWFLVELACLFVLFQGILNRVDPGETQGRNPWVALFATAVYGVHPVVAETVNYVVQRADLYAALGAVAGLVIYAELPRARRFGLYLIPVVVGILSKQSAAVFPALLCAWIWLIEGEKLFRSVLRSLPAVLVAGVVAVFTLQMTPASYITGAVSPFWYRVTQPAVLLGYFVKFFIPAGLSADTDRRVLNSFSQPEAIYGTLFLVALLALGWWCAKRKEFRLVAFGIVWFLVTSLPTSLVPLAEVENDHRMFFPFIGMALSVCWFAAKQLEQRAVPQRVTATLCILILAGLTMGTRARNQVWKSEESLWYDVTLKSPNNGRGLMNYGLTQMASGHYAEALAYFERALFFNPNYYVLEINLGIANGGVGNALEAERHFQRAITLAPADASARYYYARWLNESRRTPEAIPQLMTAIQANPDYVGARYALLQIYSDLGDAENLRRLAVETKSRFPNDTVAAAWLASGPRNVRPTGSITADDYVLQSLARYREGKFAESIAAAEQALKLRPDYAEAWNNIGAAYNSIGQWERASAALRQAIRLKPDFQLARNNLAVAEAELRKPRRAAVAK